MSYIQRIVSPDQRFFILVEESEIRMSHWIKNATLGESQSQRLMLQVGNWQWSSEEILWSADSRFVTIGLRRYPGDADGIVIDIYPDRQVVVPHAPAATEPLSFGALDAFLEDYYQQHRRDT